MLSEIRHARQVQGEGFRRWFTDDYFDLIVWYGDNNVMIGFQLCYDKKDRERALTWTVDHGFQHNRIDSGEVPGHVKMSPLIVADGEFSVAEVAARFEKDARDMDPSIRDFVAKAVRGYPESPSTRAIPTRS